MQVNHCDMAGAKASCEIVLGSRRKGYVMLQLVGTKINILQIKRIMCSCYCLLSIACI